MEQDTQQPTSRLAAEIDQLSAARQLKGELEKAARPVALSREQGAPRDDDDMVQALRTLIARHEESGDYVTAVSCYHQLLDLLRADLGDAHPDVPTVLHDLAFMYDIEGEYAAAEAYYLEALQLQRQELDKDHPLIARTLNNLATLYNSAENPAEALPLHEEALEIRRKVYGNHHRDTAMSLANLASVNKSLGNYSTAEALYKEAIEIDREAIGAHPHPEYYAADINNLATLYYEQGRYGEAERYYMMSLGVRRELFDEKHLDVAQSLVNLSITYEALGKYTEAIQAGEQALAIRRELLGERDVILAHTLNNLAGLYEAMGEYSKAIAYYRQALPMHREYLGLDHPDFAKNLNNLAWVYQQMGDYGAAEQLYEQALDILRANPGAERPDFATGLNNLALLYHATGRDEQAEALLQQALTIRRAALGNNHQDVGTTLNNLAQVYHSQGKFGKAEELYREAAKIDRKRLGDVHPLYATDLNNLGLLNYDMGRYTEAEALLRQAGDIWRAKAGESHLGLSAALDNLAGVLAATGRASEAFALLEEVAALEDRMIGQVFSAGSEWQRHSYLQTLQNTTFSFVSLAMLPGAAPNGTLNNWLDKCLTQALRRKGLGAEAFAVQREAVLGGQYPALLPQLRELTALRRLIAQCILAGPGDPEPAAYRQQLAEWAEQQNILESTLASQIPEMNLHKQLEEADPYKVAARLGSGAALVELVRWNARIFEAVPGRNEPRWSPPRYAAFVLTTTPEYTLQVVDLGDAGALESLVHNFRSALGTMESMRSVREESTTGRRPDKLDIDTYIEAGIALRRVLFDPLLPAFGECKRLFIAPDGDLALVPLEALPLDSERYLIDEYHISYVSSGRDLLRLSIPFTGMPGPPIVASDPDFDLGREADVSAPGAMESGRETRRSMFGSLHPLHFEPLLGTRVEGERVATLLGVEPLTGGDTNKSRLKTCHSPAVLHLATHGFFISEPQYKPVLQSKYAVARGAKNVLLGLVNPLLRSGLALAGANTWLEGGTTLPEAEDGLLTAEDITGMDLLHTRLVVLSACDTGLGHVQAGEGIFGLRRAFVLAGASTLVMSLWRVPDHQTEELMVTFYEALLSGLGPADALRVAQLALKTRHRHPLYWGAFICQGDPAPLSLPYAAADPDALSM